MNKRGIVQKIIAALMSELELYHKAARFSRAEATDEQNKAENKYDTRGLEASYLARGQCKQAADAEAAIKEFEKMALRDFGAGDPIDLGALVELQTKKERTTYFVGPRAGGTEVNHDGKEVLVITPQSPLAQELIGKKLGAKLQLEIGGARSEYKIVSVA
jgi:transcription elongation GreA/GreB family factor